jgi:preprotein translocase subunit SecY
VISNLLNVFRIHDLRNKILFVIAMVAVYRFGVQIRVPGVDPIAIEQLRESASQQGALGSPAARSRVSRSSRSGSCRTSRRASSCRCSES